MFPRIKRLPYRNIQKNAPGALALHVLEIMDSLIKSAHQWKIVTIILKTPSKHIYCRGFYIIYNENCGSRI